MLLTPFRIGMSLIVYFFLVERKERRFNVRFKSQSQSILFQNKITLHTNTATIKRLPEKDKALTSWLPIYFISPSRDNVGDALSTEKETNYASHAESPNRDPEESHTRCRVKIQNTDRGRGRSKGGKGES